jgi:hypothetical protein
VALVSLGYAIWLGAHWLPLSYSSGEIPLYASRVWDMHAELARSGHVAFWSSVFMNGSSTALPYTCFPLVPWFLLAPVVGLVAAGKLVALASIAASGVTMFFCARHFVKAERAALFAALAYLFHPLLLVRAAGPEHISVVVFAALLPLGWLLFARVVEESRAVDVARCAATFALLSWTQDKQMTLQLPFLGVFAVASLARRKDGRPTTVRALALLGAQTILLTAFFVVPVASEVKLLRLFEGEPLDGWQRFFSIHSLGDLVTRSRSEPCYFGVVLAALIGAAALFPKVRKDRPAFWLLAAFLAAAVALGHGPESVGSALARAFFVSEGGASGSPTSIGALESGVFLVAAGVGALTLRSKLTTLRARLCAVTALAAFVFVPWFRLLALAPLYQDIRAPDAFCQVPCAFFGALLAGFFVTDALEPRVTSRNRSAVFVGLLAGLLVLDASSFQLPMMQSDVSEATIDRARALYARLGEEAKHEGGKVFLAAGTRPFHLMGPSWGGPPLVNEELLGYMAPRWSGRLRGPASAPFERTRGYLDLVGAHWVVFDKAGTSPRRQEKLAAYRSAFALDFEDEDVVVFHTTTAHSYVSGYARTALAVGDSRELPALAVDLASAGYLLVQAPHDRIEVTPLEELSRSTSVYVSTPPASPLPAEVTPKIVVLGTGSPRLPPTQPRGEPIEDVVVTRDAAERITARFTSRVPCIAVVDESFYPYWHATLDGRPVEPLRVAYGLIGVATTEGAHQLELRYEAPRAYAWSALLSALTLAVTGVIAFASRRRV